MVFDIHWFNKHQQPLLLFANTPFGRWSLGLWGKRSSVGMNKIIRIEPNAIYWRKGEEICAEFRTHDKFAKRLYYDFKPIWSTIHALDMLMLPQYNLGFDTLTAFPAAGDVSPVDGYASREGVNQSFGNISLFGVGTNASTGGSTGDDTPHLVASSTTNQFQILRRSFFLFDTSSLGASAIISGATFSTYGSASNTKSNQLGDPDYCLGSASPASDSTLVAADYQTRGTTRFGAISYASFTASQYNDITLNASGLANISKTGISKFSGQLSWDIDNSFVGSWAGNASSGFRATFADTSGTNQDPKLVVTFSSGGAFLLNLL